MIAFLDSSLVCTIGVYDLNNDHNDNEDDDYEAAGVDGFGKDVLHPLMRVLNKVLIKLITNWPKMIQETVFQFLMIYFEEESVVDDIF